MIGSVAFVAPWLLAGFAVLPILWWLLRAVPPAPGRRVFPGVRLLLGLRDPEKMPENLRHAHEHNDEVLERIYIGRRFKNDTERLEKLFDLYTKMTADVAKAAPKVKKGKKA